MITIELSEDDVKKLIINHVERLLGSVTFDLSNVKIMVKSKQNYKSEWEPAALKVEGSAEIKAVIST